MSIDNGGVVSHTSCGSILRMMSLKISGGNRGKLTATSPNLIKLEYKYAEDCAVPYHHSLARHPG